MNTLDIEKLNRKFAIKRHGHELQIKPGKGGIPVVEIHNDQASAVISLQGAHLLSWIPTAEQEVIWVSEDAQFKAGKSVRGGIPICWPWFGAHPTQADFPAHGFARNMPWQIIGTTIMETGATAIRFTTEPDPAHSAMWPEHTSVQYELLVGKTLELLLLTDNNGSEAIHISQALHTYFRVKDVRDVVLKGLDQTDYLDKLDHFNRKTQQRDITINAEIDRVYVDTDSDCIIEDRGFQRNIIIRKQGSHSTVVWNPWQQTAEKMGDLGEQGYLRMLCVESSNAESDAITIQPGQSHRLWVEYQLQPIGG